MGALKDQETGGLFVYSDENQRIFQRYGAPPVPLAPLILDHNLRNTRQIGETFKPLAPMRMTLRGGDGPAVELVCCAAQDAVESADEQVDRLLAAGWRSQEVMLLTTGKRHPSDRAWFGLRPRGLLALVLGGGRRVLWSRARLQGAGTPSGRVVHQRGEGR